MPASSSHRSPAAPTGRVAGGTAATALAAVGALHVAWGLGSSWPLPSRAELSDTVLGSPGLERGGRAACFGVGGLLGAAAVLVSGRPQQPDGPRRAAVAAMAGILAGRGVLGAAGLTHLVSPRSSSSTFRRLDRRAYSPLCLVLAALTGLSLRRGSEADPPGRERVEVGGVEADAEVHRGNPA